MREEQEQTMTLLDYHINNGLCHMFISVHYASLNLMLIMALAIYL